MLFKTTTEDSLIPNFYYQKLNYKLFQLGFSHLRMPGKISFLPAMRILKAYKFVQVSRELQTLFYPVPSANRNLQGFLCFWKIFVRKMIIYFYISLYF